MATLGDVPVQFENYQARLMEALTGRSSEAWRDRESVAAS